MIAYGLLKFVFDVDINFIHIYGILFVIELLIMLVIGYWMPMQKPWQFINNSKVDMTPWVYGLPVAITMVSCVIIIYLLFSPLGLVGGLSPLFWVLIAAVIIMNAILCWLSIKYWHQKYADRLAKVEMI